MRSSVALGEQRDGHEDHCPDEQAVTGEQDGTDTRRAAAHIGVGDRDDERGEQQHRPGGDVRGARAPEVGPHQDADADEAHEQAAPLPRREALTRQHHHRNGREQQRVCRPEDRGHTRRQGHLAPVHDGVGRAELQPAGDEHEIQGRPLSALATRKRSGDERHQHPGEHEARGGPRERRQVGRALLDHEPGAAPDQRHEGERRGEQGRAWGRKGRGGGHRGAGMYLALEVDARGLVLRPAAVTP